MNETEKKSQWKKWTKAEKKAQQNEQIVNEQTIAAALVVRK